MSETKLIECESCDAKVSAKILAVKEYSPEDGGDPHAIFFLECPACGRTMVGASDYVQLEYDVWGYDHPTRLWPYPKKKLDWSIPTLVRDSIEEARACFRAKAYSATAVMCGRTLEAVCKIHGVTDFNLAKGIRTLKEKGIIDNRMFEWGEELRKHRNIGAHASEEKINREDAEDVLDFWIAICDYIYVLAEKYKKFQERKTEKEKKAKKLD